MFGLRIPYVQSCIADRENAQARQPLSTELINHEGTWDALEGVAYSFWAAYSTLMILGLRLLLKMTALLLLQCLYKLVWLIAVAYPLWRDNHFDDARGLATIFIVGIVLDLLIIPWQYAFRTYLSTASSRT